MDFKPLFDQVLVRPITQGKTQGGLHIPDTASSPFPPMVRVVAVGPGLRAADGTVCPPTVNVGDVVYPISMGVKFEMDIGNGLEVLFLISEQESIRGIYVNPDLSQCKEGMDKGDLAEIVAKRKGN